MGKGTAARSAYARAGVDVAAGDRAVERMRAAVDSTRRPEVV
ncbi:MAG TPA: phosphoribosylformylglycinamidine cyclo-ligase, partial [Candidatus Dormibacteraeota bacterium]|nr:phosphoribosylformylglycinamidine cyclo-ligase [Candidatus Dormibacteraeota bacterium]